ncbi:MAG TPA: hypothetical protein VHP37_32055 [Burkholderiales bacterium]|nr:hypothetical protein [Burkholderiales bacterium]
MLNRRPQIDTACADLDWTPRVGMEETLMRLFEDYGPELPALHDLMGAPHLAMTAEPTPHRRRSAV